MTTTHTDLVHGTDPATVASTLLGELETAWNAGDGQAFGRAYADGASFVNVRGEHVVGRGAIAGGHQGIFDSIYRDSTNRMELVSAEALADGVVLAVSAHTLDVPGGPLAGRHRATCTSVLTRLADGRWVFASSQNTLVTG
jgi:uncharacterized protein (TIGR02246 family)